MLSKVCPYIGGCWSIIIAKINFLNQKQFDNILLTLHGRPPQNLTGSENAVINFVFLIFIISLSKLPLKIYIHEKKLESETRHLRPN